MLGATASGQQVLPLRPPQAGSHDAFGLCGPFTHAWTAQWLQMHVLAKTFLGKGKGNAVHKCIITYHASSSHSTATTCQLPTAACMPQFQKHPNLPARGAMCTCALLQRLTNPTAFPDGPCCGGAGAGGVGGAAVSLLSSLQASKRSSFPLSRALQALRKVLMTQTIGQN
jgi:hypothetical protein